MTQMEQLRPLLTIQDLGAKKIVRKMVTSIERAARRSSRITIKLIALNFVYLLMLSTIRLLDRFRQLSPEKVRLILIMMLFILLYVYYAMTTKLTVILCIIRESYATCCPYMAMNQPMIEGYHFMISAGGVLSACQCDILVNTMDDCNPLAAISSFSVSTGNI